MTRLPFKWILALSFGIVAVQALVLCVLALDVPFREAWRELVHWDGYWYRSILIQGYHSHFPPAPGKPEGDNVAFFPAYPILARGLRIVSGASPDFALVTVSLVAGFAFWTYFLLLCEQRKIPVKYSLGALALLLSYYGTFFLGVAYSDGLALASFLGLVYFTERHAEDARRAWPLALVHGIVLSGTRLTGAGLCAYPLLFGMLRGRREGNGDGKLWSYVALSFLSLLGVGAFFAYCQLRFGHWDLYFLTQRAGWGSAVEPFLPLNPLTYLRPTRSHIETTAFYSGERLGYAASVLVIALFSLAAIGELILARREGRTFPSGWEGRWPLYLVGWGSFHLSLARAGAQEFSGMYRYALPTLVALLFAFLDLGGRMPAPKYKIGSARWAFFLLLALPALSLLIQYDLALQYMAGLWME